MENSKKRKFNVIDLVVIVILVLAVAFIGWKVIGGRSASGQSYKLTYQVRVDHVEEVSLDCITQFGTPCQLVANTSLVPGAYVVDISEYDNSGEIKMQFNDKGGIITPVSRQGVGVIFTVEAIITDNVNNTVATQNIRIGANNTVKTSNYEFEGTVVYLEKEAVDGNAA